MLNKVDGLTDFLCSVAERTMMATAVVTDKAAAGTTVWAIL